MLLQRIDCPRNRRRPQARAACSRCATSRITRRTGSTPSTHYRGPRRPRDAAEHEGFVALEMLKHRKASTQALGTIPPTTCTCDRGEAHCVRGSRRRARGSRSHPKRARPCSEDTPQPSQDINMARVTPRFSSGVANHPTRGTAGDLGRDLGDTIYMTAADGRATWCRSSIAVRHFGAGFVPAKPALRCTTAVGFNLTQGHQRDRPAQAAAAHAGAAMIVRTANRAAFA